MSTRIRAIFIIVVGLLLLIVGVGAALLLINRISPNTAAQPQNQVVKSPVVVLARDMKLGDRISAADVTIQQIPVDVVPRDALSTPDAAIGRILKSDMVQGEMVLQHSIADPTNNNHDLSFILANDHVLMAFPAIDLMSKDNLIQRGDIIDILATYQVSAADLGANTPSTTNTTTNPTTQVSTPQPPVNFTIDAFQKVSVTALVLNVVTDQNGKATGENTLASYLLALSPQDALVLKHLKDLNANFDVVLRSPTSTTQFDLAPVDEKYIVELYGLSVVP